MANDSTTYFASRSFELQREYDMEVLSGIELEYDPTAYAGTALAPRPSELGCYVIKRAISHPTCHFCHVKSEKNYGTCEHCGAPL